MKVLISILIGLLVVGCGKNEIKPSPDVAANELHTEAMKLISQAEEKTKFDLRSAIADYKLVLSKINEITENYPKSALAEKLVSNELELSGKTLQAIKERVDELETDMKEYQSWRAEKNKLKEQRELNIINYGRSSYYISILGQLRYGVTSYLGDNDGWYPPSDKWSDSLVPYLPIDALEKWLVKDKQTGLSIMYNSGLKGKHEAETENPNTVVFFYQKMVGGTKAVVRKMSTPMTLGKRLKIPVLLYLLMGVLWL